MANGVKEAKGDALLEKLCEWSVCPELKDAKTLLGVRFDPKQAAHLLLRTTAAIVHEQFRSTVLQRQLIQAGQWSSTSSGKRVEAGAAATVRKKVAAVKKSAKGKGSRMPEEQADME